MGRWILNNKSLHKIGLKGWGIAACPVIQAIGRPWIALISKMWRMSWGQGALGRSFLADSASALALGLRWLAFLADVNPRQGVGSFRCWGKRCISKCPHPAVAGLITELLDTWRTKVLTHHVLHRLNQSNCDVRDGPPSRGCTRPQGLA